MYAKESCVARLVGVLLFACALSHSAQATVGFKSAVSYPVERLLWLLPWGFQRRRKPDLAVATLAIPRLATTETSASCLALAMAHFNPHSVSPPARTRSPSQWVTSMETATRTWSSRNNGINPAGGWLAGTVSVLLGNGDGTFQEHSTMQRSRSRLRGSGRLQR